jgi:hypothetical protein
MIIYTSHDKKFFVDITCLNLKNVKIIIETAQMLRAIFSSTSIIFLIIF